MTLVLHQEMLLVSNHRVLVQHGVTTRGVVEGLVGADDEMMCSAAQTEGAARGAAVTLAAQGTASAGVANAGASYQRRGWSGIWAECA